MRLNSAPHPKIRRMKYLWALCAAFLFTAFLYGALNLRNGLWFDEAGSFSEGLAVIVIDNKYGYIDTTGRTVISPKFELSDPSSAKWDGASAISFSGGLAVVVLNGKYGYVNKQGVIAISPQFDSARAFADGLAWVSKNGRPGYINKQGEMVIQLDSLEFPLNFAQYVEKNLKAHDKSELTEAPKFPSVFAPSFSEGVAPLEQIDVDGYRTWGYIDKTGSVVIEAMFDHARNFREGLAAIAPPAGAGKPTLWGFIDKFGNIAVEPQFNLVSHFSEGLAHCMMWDVNTDEFFTGDWTHIFINQKGTVVIGPEFNGAGSYSDGLAWVKVGDKYGYIDKTGSVKIKPQFNGAGDFSEGLAKVNVGKPAHAWAELLGESIGKWGYIDKTGKYIIEPKYHMARDFSEGLAAIQLNGKWGFIGADGRLLTKK